MNIKSAIVKIVSDCDLRHRFLAQMPKAFDDYLLLKDGRIVTRLEAERLDAFKYLIDGLNFISSRV